MPNPSRTQAAFIKFDGHYGGDLYEDWLHARLAKRLDLKKIAYPRKGGVQTLASLARLLVAGYSPTQGPIIRPFSVPIYRRNAIVVFHHFDHSGVPWFARCLESFDFLLLRRLAGPLGIRFLVVSDYWSCWLRDRGLRAEFLVYNELPLNDAADGWPERSRLAQIYGLDPARKWIFLGGDQHKKGGRRIVELFVSKGMDPSPYQFIVSGKNSYTDAFVSSVWIDLQDYSGFLRQLHLVIANSQFEEGWCRVAHEGLMSGVPVVGSGAGGMSELLALAGSRKKFTEEEMIDALREPPTLPPQARQAVASHLESHNELELERLRIVLASRAEKEA